MDLICSFDLFDPLSAAQTDHTPNGLQYMIDLQAEIDPESRQVEHQTCQNTQRYGCHPQKYIVSQHQYLCIAAAAENTLGHNTVCRLEHNDDTDGQHHKTCESV